MAIRMAAKFSCSLFTQLLNIASGGAFATVRALVRQRRQLRMLSARPTRYSWIARMQSSLLEEILIIIPC